MQTFDMIPNDVKERLMGVNQALAEANSNFGAKRVENFPGYPALGTHSRQCLVKIDIKWDAKFKFKKEGSEVVRDAMAVEFSYTCFGAPDEGKSCAGEYNVIPYDMSNLPEDKGNNVKWRATRDLSRVCTNFRGILGCSEDEFNAKKDGGGWPIILKEVFEKMAALEAAGTAALFHVDFVIRMGSDYTAADGTKKKGQLEGVDIIKGLVGGNQAKAA